MDKIKLKPCPFCGHKAVIDDCGDNRYFVRCSHCSINQDKLYAQKCDAVKAWNSRVTMDDLTSRQAVKQLDLFTKTFCRDKSVKNDLVFRCSQCDFQLPDRTCLVKTMARKLCPDYKNFGSMGDL